MILTHMIKNYDTLIAASFNVTSGLSDIRSRWSQSEQRGLRGTNSRCESPDLGGCFAVFDLSSGLLVSKYAFLQPNGFCISDENGLVIASIYDRSLHRINPDGVRQPKLTNKYFNDPHSVVRTERGFLVTSTGLDLILEVDNNGRSLWEFWLASTEAYKQTPLGIERNICPSAINGDESYSTLQQTTHVNSAIFQPSDEVFSDKERYVLATLFHQGQLIRIDRSRQSIEVLMDGLNCPHSIRKTKSGYLLSDSRNHRVLVLKPNFTIQYSIGPYINDETQLGWVQDAFMLSDSLMVIADADNNRFIVLDTDSGQPNQVLPFPSNWRIYQADLFM